MGLVHQNTISVLNCHDKPTFNCTRVTDLEQSGKEQFNLLEQQKNLSMMTSPAVNINAFAYANCFKVLIF